MREVASDYLFDKEGTDPEIESLETLLRPLAWKGGPRAPTALVRVSAPEPAPERRPGASRAFAVAGALALAAALAIAVVGPFAPRPPEPAYEIVGAASGPLRLERGAAIEVRESVTIELAGLGRLLAEPGARLSVLAIDDELHKLRLERGEVHARIGWNVRPRLFQIETPATTCVDLGCHYTLSVDPSGGATVRVTAGRVAFADRGREVLVPSGATCRAAPGRGSGTPVFEDAAPAFRVALETFDRATDPRERAGLALVLAGLARRERDTLSLWHLLADPDAAVRSAASAGLARIVREPRPSPATAEAWKEALEPMWW